MTNDILAGLPARRGHFLLESGYRTDVWLTLDELFVDTSAVAPRVAALADRLRPYGANAVCGPLLGGAFSSGSFDANRVVLLGRLWTQSRTYLVLPDGQGAL